MKIKLLIILLFSNIIYSQISTSLVEVTKPNPSVANLMNFVDIPVNTHTGVPNIDIPLISIPTTNKNLNVNVGLSYHSAGVAFTSRASDVGTGWNLMAGGVISRTVTDLPDEYIEAYYQGLGYSLDNIKFNDIYSYNFMGHSGKFKIVYNYLDNTFTINKLEVNTMDITCVMVPGTHKVESFTIYDDKGLKYIFNVKDRNKTFFLNQTSISQQISISQPYQPYPDPYYYDSAYYLSKVFDNNNVELTNLSYITHVKPGLVSGGAHDEITNKVNNIESLNFGSISFVYDYYESPAAENKLNDPFTLNEIVLKNKKDEIINKFNLSYYELNIHKIRRHLYKIKKIDVVSQKTEEHEFEYQTEIINTSPFYCNSDFYYGIDKFGYLNFTWNPGQYGNYEGYVTDGLFYEEFNERTSKDACLYGALKKIKFPTGGKAEFEFESNTFRYSTSPYDLTQNFMHQYDIENTDNHIYTEILNTHYLTNNGTKNIPLVITGSEPVKVFIKLYPVAYYSQLNDPVTEPLYASFRLVGNGVDEFLERITPTCLGDFIILDPGSYTIIVSSLENSSGDIVITKKELTTQPIKQWIYGGGLRIKKISHFNSYFDITPQREVNYEYNMFNDSNLTSGELYDGYYRSFANNKATNAQISYKNVKIFDTQNNGYTKHTYESYTDSQYYTNSVWLDYFQNYFGYKNGILKKVEVFNSNGDVLKVTENDYEFTESGNAMYISSMLDYNFGWFYAKPCWSKLISSTNKEYFYPSGSSNPSILETFETYSYKTINKQISEKTVTNSNGEILKTNYYYHYGNSIHSQNRISEIERVETSRAGQPLSTSKINYSNNWGSNVSYLPHTIETSKGTNALETKIRYNKYDAFSNPLEVQQENGTKISYIWGYNNTQPVAKLENIAYDAIPTNLITAIQNATDSSTLNETTILNALNALRNSSDVNLQKAMITTYTYKPLVGITTVTDPKGDKQTYYYDGFNRLEFVKDKNGNILSENKYHYRTQN